MKKVIRLTESELNRIIENSVKRVFTEDVLGNDWRENDYDDDEALNNYEAFYDQVKDYDDENEHDWSGQGEEDIDPSFYEDPDQYRNDVLGWGNDLMDYEYDGRLL